MLGSVIQHGFLPMDAYSTEHNDFAYSADEPVLVAATSDVALARALRSVEASGARVAAQLSLGEVQDRLELQGSAAAMWLEIDEDGGDLLDELLSRVRRDASAGRYAAVVSTTGSLIDPVAARLFDDAVEIVVDGDDAARVSALAMAVARRSMGARISDVASDRSAEQLRQLSDEVGRIASALARLSTGPGSGLTPAPSLPVTGGADVTAESVRSIIRARRLRARYFSEELFADPAWDMLLDLLQAEIAQLRVPVSSLCIAAAVPATTALRWLKTLVSEGLFLRRPDPHDGRRVYVELAPDASDALRRYFAEVGQVAVI
jgi:DNA-binding MarR family transcriptional regulator